MSKLYLMLILREMD